MQDKKVNPEQEGSVQHNPKQQNTSRIGKGNRSPIQAKHRPVPRKHLMKSPHKAKQKSISAKQKPIQRKSNKQKNESENNTEKTDTRFATNLSKFQLDFIDEMRSTELNETTVEEIKEALFGNSKPAIYVYSEREGDYSISHLNKIAKVAQNIYRTYAP